MKLDRFFKIGVIPFLLSFHAGIFAQLIKTPYDLEIPITGRTYEVLPAKDQLFLYRLSKDDENLYLDVISLDTTLQEQWNGHLKLPVGINYILAGTVYHEKDFYFIFRSPDNTLFEIVSIQLAQKNYKTYLIKNSLSFEPVKFSMVNQVALIGGYYQGIPVVLYANLDKNEQKTIFGGFNAKDKIDQLRIYKDNSFDVLLSGKGRTRRSAVWIKNYNPDGKLLKDVAVESDASETLAVTHAIKVNDTLQIITGSYGKAHSHYSNGLFTAIVGSSAKYDLSFHSYGAMKNAFQRMPSQITDLLNIEFSTHALLANTRQYFTIGEADYPKYSSKNYNYLGKGDTTKGKRNFRHMVVTCFNERGNLLWENSFKCPFNAYISTCILENEMLFLYSKSDTIQPVILRSDGAFTSTPLKMEGNSIAEDKSAFKLTYWYNHFFIAHKILRGNSPSDGNNTISNNKLMIIKIEFKN